ncbi:proliferating cell nuclear antigen-like [Watersipora subatra]|uniref:proliferating cell nuclear antigen-like n=1 Tax=Watersipora subatra TaxID=2589382 RepID=UPI00355BC88B
MFEARMSDSSVMKRLMEAITTLIEDGSFDVSSKGLSLQAMDSSHVALVSMCLRNEAFDPFRCDRNLSLGVQFKQMSKIIKCAGNNDVMTMKAEDDGDVLNLVFESSNGERMSEFAMKLTDIDSEQVGIPETEYSAIIKMPSSEFARVCRDLSNFGESVTICVTKDGLKFSVKGDSSNASMKFSQTGSGDDNNDVTIDLNDPCTLTFAVKYLTHFCKASSLSERVTLSLSNDNPLVVEYKIGDGLGHIRYYLAPKMMDDD